MTQHRKHYMDLNPNARALRRSRLVANIACIACFAMIGIFLGLGV